MPRLLRPGRAVSLLCSLLLAVPACAPSVQQEVAMGNQYAAQLQQQLPLIDDPAITSLFQSAVAPLKRVAQRQDLAWDFHIVNSDQVNAFAVPGGHVYVFRGLIERARHYDEFAGAVTHEIGHVDLRHSAQQMGQANAANTGLTLAYLLLGRQPSTAEQVGLGLAGNMVFAKFSRDDEREADSMAVLYTTRAGIDPDGIAGMFEVLQGLQQSEPGKVEQWFASHPATSERITNVQRMIAANPSARTVARTGRRDLAAFESLQRKLRALPPAPKELPSQ
ncbi:MAG TPA: M48 family metallopeptidase [Gemmatimonadales bacterium]|nr:M48 family metallopeptidase [Gemmatimonadales bacterium]